ncbi:MAG: S41 family peptidase [Pseudomonadota bacterium]
MRASSLKISLLVLGVAALVTLAVHLSPLPRAQAASDADYQRMQVFTEVLGEIEKKYVEKKTQEELITEALKGMVSSLDPHSAYLTPDEFRDLQIETKGSFHGVGIEITLKDGILTVVSPIEGTPAFKAGVQAGDRIIKIDGKLTKGMSLMDAVKLIRGPKGSKVTLTVLREGAPKLLDYAIARDLIPLRSVRFNLLEDGYGYVRIASFQEDTTNDLVKALRVLQSQKLPLKGLVLDLRNNPGGLLQEAVSVSDVFLKGGVIVSTKGRLAGQQMTYSAHKDAVAGDYPIIVLVNNGSASASEIVAGALQDHKRALLLGITTFGKGSVQTILPLEDRGALRLTTARYYTPSGRSIQAKGIEPDLVVPFEPPAKDKKNDNPSQAIREKDLSGVLPAEETAPPAPLAPPSQEPAKAKDNGDAKLYMAADKLNDDNQLVRALDLLKAWQVFAGMPARPVPAPAAPDAGK